jgi:hypothetical protein
MRLQLCRAFAHRKRRGHVSYDSKSNFLQVLTVKTTVALDEGILSPVYDRQSEDLDEAWAATSTIREMSVNHQKTGRKRSGLQGVARLL